jgi:hypothetical protein
MALTPEQFNIIATKEDLKDMKREITEELGEKLDQVLNAVDGLAKHVKDFRIEMASNQAAHDRFETRISKLEEKGMIVRDEEAK